MKQVARGLVVGILGATALALAACGPSRTTRNETEEEETGPGPGPDATPVASCGAPACTTDVAAARSALVAGDYQGAFDLYECADTPEAAFGAGLTRVLLALEGDNADAVLADLGLPPLPASDIFGENGLLGREAARWNGEGTLTLSGGLDVTLTFDRAQHRVSENSEDTIGYFRAEDTASPANAGLGISLYTSSIAPPFTNGTVLSVTNDCTRGFPVTTRDERLGWLDLHFEVGDASYWCEIPYSLSAAECQADGGSIVVTEAATVPGQQATYQFQNLLLSCYGSGSGSSGVVRVSGTATGVAVSESLDTSGLHPLLRDVDAPSVPAGTSFNALLQHGGAAAAELEHAACFFKRAAEGSGHVFDVPGVLFGGSDVPLSKGDSEIVAAFALLGAAAGHLAWVHEADLPLDRIICESSDPVPCFDDEEFAARFNDAFASPWHPGRLLVVERLVVEALELLERGLGDLDEASLLVRNEASSAGLDAMRTMVQGALGSLRTGGTVLPRVTPGIPIDLRALFENPRNPRSAGDVLNYEEECDDFGYCWSDFGIDLGFVDSYFAGRIDADWEHGDYEYLDDTAVEDALSEIGNRIGQYTSLGD